MFADYLLENYWKQQANFGPVVHLPIMISAKDFPEAALRLYEAHMLPKAKQAGTQFAALKAMHHALPDGGLVNSADFRDATGWIAKPLPDVARFKAEWKQRTIWASTAPPLAHSILLFGRIFDAVLLFTLGHEYAHVALGHAQQAADSAARSREDEVAADHWAATNLTSIASFDLRAVALLFAFLIENDEGASLGEREHPFPADRMGLLIAAIGSNENLRMDLNAATRLLRRSIEVGGIEATCVGAVSCSWSVDLQHMLCLELTFGETHDNHQGLAFELILEIRDAVHPTTIYRTGSVRVPLILASDVEYISVLNGEIRSALHRTLYLPLPPSWWLDVPDSVTAVTAISLVHAAMLECADWTCATALADEPMLTALDPVIATDLPLAEAAARAARNGHAPEIAIRVAEKVCAASAGPSSELRQWLAEQHAARGEWVQAMEALKPALDLPAELGPGARLVYAKAVWNTIPAPGWFGRRDPKRTIMVYDYAWRESILRKDEELGRQALDFSVAVLKAERGQPIFRKYIEAVDRHNDAREFLLAGQLEAAARSLKIAIHLYVESIGLTELDSRPVFLMQLISEAMFTAGQHLSAWLSDASDWLPAAEEAFGFVVERDPGFAPAYTERAKLALEANKLAAASREIEAANAVAPAHGFIEYVRRELRRRVRQRLSDLEGRVDALASTGSFADAAAMARSDSDLLELDGAPHAWCARAAFQAGLVELAASAIERAIALEGGAFDHLVMQAEIVLEQGDAALARDLVTIAEGYAAVLPTEEIAEASDGRAMHYSDKPTRALSKAVGAWAHVIAGGDPSIAYGAVVPLLGQSGLGGRTHFYIARLLAAMGDKASARKEAAVALAEKIYTLTVRQTQTVEAMNFV